MKIYFHMNVDYFSNTYVVVNELEKKAIIIDPGKISLDIINQLEDGNYTLSAVLITHNHKDNTAGLSTLRKIYDVAVFAADSEITGAATSVINGDGSIKVAGFNVGYFNLPGHSSDSMVYKIGNVLFTGDTIEAGRIGDTTSSYSKRILVMGIKEKILSQQDGTFIMPGHGPMTSVGAEKIYNMDIVD